MSGSFDSGHGVDDDWEPTPEDYAVLDGVDAEYDVDTDYVESRVVPSSVGDEAPAERIVMAPLLQAAPAVSTDAVEDGSVPVREVIGRASATERAPSSSEEFQFWMGPDEMVNPFDIVEVEHMRGTTTFGLVTNIEHLTDAPSHLSNFVSMDFGDVNTEEQTPRTQVNIATVTVMANDSEYDDQGVYMPVQNGSVCRYASQDGILRALGIDKIPPQRQVPAGLISLSNGTSAPVYLDADFVLGPEAAHINITGISGLATKTSYAMFVIQSILQTVGASDVAVIMLNVKHDDLLHVHKPNLALSDDDRADWRRLGLEPEPFRSVTYLLPLRKGKSLVPNCHGSPPMPHKLYAYSLRDVVGTAERPGPGIESLLRTPDSSGTMASMVSEIEHNLHIGSPQWSNATDWNALVNGEPLVKDGKAVGTGDIQKNTVGKFRRVMRSAVLQSHSGVFVKQRAQGVNTPGQRVRAIRGGQTLVIDIAQLREHERALVFSDVINEVHRMYAEESGALQGDKNGDATNNKLPSKVIIFVDELNKYAPPTRGEASAVTDYVLDIAARGRSLGVVLVSAEQFMSEVHHQVVGSCATKLVGRSDSAEVAKDTYRGIVANDLRAQVTRLGKGYMLLSHPVFRQSVRVKFPQPAYELIGHSGGSVL